MSDFPPYRLLKDVPRPQLYGALHELTDTVWNADYDRDWLRDIAMRRAIAVAFGDLLTSRVAKSAADKPPQWFAPHIRRLISDYATRMGQSGTFFVDIRTMERLNLVELPVSDEYVLAMVSEFGDRSGEFPRADLFHEDPELIDRALWRAFEVEGGGEVSLANIDKFSTRNTWRNAILRLVSDGTLPTDRILDATLDALGRDFSTYRVSWFAGLHTALAPDISELAGRQERYLRLLGSRVGNTVGLAAKALASIDKAGKLDHERFVELCPAGLATPAKSTATIIVRILERSTAPPSTVAHAAGTGLDHPSADVQRRSLALLRRLDAPDIAREHRDSLEPSVLQDAEAWLGELSETPAELSIPDMLSSVKRDPVTDDDLAERVAALLEDQSDPFELELVLAGLARIPEAAELLSPVVKRAKSVYRRLPSGPGAEIAALVLAVAGHAQPWPNRVPAGFEFSDTRLVEIAGSPRRTLLATPTAEGGWISPDVLVERAHTMNGAPLLSDAVAALLRLAPEGRDDALPRASTVDGEFGEALRYALGGGAAPIRTPALWVAAARTRSPFSDDEYLLSAGLAGAGRGHAASYRLALTPEPYTYDDGGQSRTITWHQWTISTDPTPGTPTATEPTAVVPSSDGRHPGPTAQNGDWLMWTATVWPHDAEAFFAGSIGHVLEACEGSEVSYDASTVLSVLVTHPGRLGPMAARTLAAGLCAQRAPQHAIAVDAFAARVPSGQISVDSLAAAMADVCAIAPVTRWSARLREAASISPATGHAACGLLTTLLPRLDTELRGIGSALDTLHEESLRLGLSISDTALRNWLGGFTGPSKSARTAKALLA